MWGMSSSKYLVNLSRSTSAARTVDGDVQCGIRQRKGSSFLLWTGQCMTPLMWRAITCCSVLNRNTCIPMKFYMSFHYSIAHYHGAVSKAPYGEFTLQSKTAIRRIFWISFTAFPNLLWTKQTPWRWDRKRAIPTKRPPLVGEVGAKFAVRRYRVVRATDLSGRQYRFSRSEPLLFHSSYPHEAEWASFQTHYFSENLLVPGI
jgi:hypothetical protein